MASEQRGSRQRPAWWVGALAVLAAVVAAEAFALLLPEDAQPFDRAGFLLVLAAVLAASWRGGLVAALTAGAVGTAGTMHLFLVFGDPLGPPVVRLAVGVLIGGFGLGLGALVGHLRDRERRALEALVREREAMEASNRALARSNAALRAANETLEAFTYVASHDLKEPVRALDAYGCALLEDHAHLFAAEPEARHLAERMRAATGRLGRLLEGLLDYSRAARIAPDELEVMRVEEALWTPDCATRFDHLLVERNARLVVEPGPPVLASRAGLCQVLGNLVLNSIKHTDGDATVRVRSFPSPRDPGAVEVVVEDNGPGFPERVLRNFGHAKAARPSTLGGGFGLIITRQAVEKMGGALWLRNLPDGGGGAAHFTLPAAQARLEKALPPVGQR